MGARIKTLQQQAREIGRLRTGYSEAQTSRDGRSYTAAVKSATWILSSAQQDAIELAAEMWGGQAELWQPQGAGQPVWRVITEQPAIDAILPPGDPLSQAYEMWNRGGCVVRCDGETARNPVNNAEAPCLCRARYQEDWYRRKSTEVCRPHTRLNVILPQLPDLGTWRAETQSFYAASDLPAQVGLIRAAVGDRMVPISLRIVPLTRVRGGETIQTQTIVLSIRGAVAGQLLAGQVPAIEAGAVPALAAAQQRRGSSAADPNDPYAVLARSAAPVEAWLAEIAVCGSVQSLRDLWAAMKAADSSGEITPEDAAVIKPAWWAKKQQLDQAERAAEPALDIGSAGRTDHGGAVAPSVEPTPKQVELPSPPEPPLPADGPEPDPTAVWAEIVGRAGVLGWSTDELERRFEKAAGVSQFDADGYAMESFRNLMVQGKV